MKNAVLMFFIIILGLGGIAAYSAAYTVHETQTALVLRFGEPKKVILKPGLNWKLPLAETVVFFDKRILDVEISSKEVLVADQKRLVVNAFTRYKIVNPLRFFQRLKNEMGAIARLQTSMESALRSVLGNASFVDVVKDKREALMRQIAERMNAEADTFGIKIIDVRILRADLPKENSQAIFNRMKTEREREAAGYRAEGAKEAQRIRATADREATIIKAEAKKEAEILRGEGDAQRNHIYAEAFGKDPDFFAFYRSMQAYQEGLKSGNTRFVITPNTDFFRYFNSPDGSGGAPATQTQR